MNKIITTNNNVQLLTLQPHLMLLIATLPTEDQEHIHVFYYLYNTKRNGHLQTLHVQPQGLLPSKERCSNHTGETF